MVIRADKGGIGALPYLMAAWSRASQVPSSSGRVASLVAAGTLAVMVLPAVASGAAVANPQAGHRPVPLGRVWASWAYDPARHNVVLFGGDTGYQSGPDVVFGQTWTWNGTTWTKRHPAVSPSPRTGAAIAWDGATHQLLLFGGSRIPFTGGGFLAGTWVWTGTTWTRLHPATSPPARHNADMVYDRARHEVILFGGYNGSYLNDTWTWNGVTWTPVHPATSPPPRDTHSMAYLPATRTTILFGGFNGTRLSDTWSWDGTTWTRLHPARSPGVVSTAWQAAYDSVSHQLILFGGDPGNGTFTSNTWAWAGTTWTRLHPAAFPAQRGYGSLTYDQTLQRLVLFAGSTGQTDPRTVWEWNGTTWMRP